DTSAHAATRALRGETTPAHRPSAAGHRRRSGNDPPHARAQGLHLRPPARERRSAAQRRTGLDVRGVRSGGGSRYRATGHASWADLLPGGLGAAPHSLVTVLYGTDWRAAGFDFYSY